MSNQNQQNQNELKIHFNKDAPETFRETETEKIKKILMETVIKINILKEETKVTFSTEHLCQNGCIFEFLAWIDLENNQIFAGSILFVDKERLTIIREVLTEVNKYLESN